MRIEDNFLSSNFIAPLNGKKESVEGTNMFSDILSNISNQENEVSQMKTEFLNGERDDIDNILVEGQKLNLQVSYALEVRNNLVDMFKQLSNMQI